MPVVFAISLAISALVIFCIALNLMRFRLQNYKKQLNFGTNYRAQRRLLAAEILSKMRVTEVLCSATFIADMALVMLFSFLLSFSCWR